VEQFFVFYPVKRRSGEEVKTDSCLVFWSLHIGLAHMTRDLRYY
jgi:hypothetical protein